MGKTLPSTDMNRRERDRYANRLENAARLIQMIAVAMKEEEDGAAMGLASIFNTFLLTDWNEINEIFIQAAKKAGSVEEEVRKAREQLDKLSPEDFNK